MLKWTLFAVAALLFPALGLAQSEAERDLQNEITVIQKEAEDTARRAQEKALRVTVQAQDLQKNLLAEHQELASLFAPSADTSVDLDLDNATIADALKQLFDRAKREYRVEGDLPADTRLSLRAKNVKFGTALDLITEAAGLRWGWESKDGKATYRIGKNVPAGFRGIFSLRGPDAVLNREALRNMVITPGRVFNGTGARALDARPYVYSVTTAERARSFTCPHCKGTVTMSSRVEPPACPKCGRRFQGDWQYCPADGTKRPATASGAVRFCPLCGKPVEVEKARGKEKESEKNF